MKTTKIIARLAQLGVIASFAAATPSMQAIELFEEDELGNINQRNVGSFKSNRFGINKGIGEIEKRTKPLQPYSTLKIEIPADVEYHETGNARVEIEAEKDAINKIQFHYSGNRLTIKTNGFATQSPVKLKLYGNDLQRVFVNSAADVALHDISVNDFLLSVRGSADVTAQGRARGCQVNAQGANDLDLGQLRCTDLTLTAQGSSDIVVSAAKSVKGRVQGAGDVEVLGNPARRTLEAIGAYDIDYR